MAFHLQTTIFGQFVRAVSRGRLFQYPDERDPSLWKGAVQKYDASASEKPSDTQTQAPPALDYQGAASHTVDEHSVLIVSWYGPDDPEVRNPPLLSSCITHSLSSQNPQNWPPGLKYLIAFQLCLLNFAVYIASSIYVPGEANLMAEFGVSEIVATLGLSLFTL
ncbi:benomyl/methotrexate resistance protein [Apiospora marii]|uniref:Benomyl/methotrexate resistance protein n=1 Tax=Apiospora marii TaxID=335849 RepID=A0ABR1RK23_9PEZI